ncbi:MAG TPA: TolC family protein [Gemmatimonadales bacterium]|jgi:cobalt-zinc-cadmium efflux system outer membrane protein|nr:TolC family protein [Gemmatimonadales bacterium]
MPVRPRTVVLLAIWLAEATVARAQVPRGAADSAARGLSAADSLDLALQPDCERPTADTTTARSASDHAPLCLTRRQAVAQALARNPQLEVAAEQVAQARARKTQATAIPDPQFEAAFVQSPGLFGAGGGTERSVTATVTIPFIDKFRLQGRVGTADVRSAGFAAALARQQITAQTTETYDSLLASLRRQRDLREARALAQDFVRRAQARFNAGTTPKLDLIRAQTELARAENDLIANDRDVANARAALNRLVGRPLGAPIAAADSLEVPPAPPDLDRLLAAALASRPELADLKSQQEGARAATGLARESWLPDFTIGVTRDYADPGPGVLFTGVSLPIPLLYWQHTHGEIGEARHRELELAASYRDLESQVGQDLRASHAAAGAALRQAVYIRDQLLPLARQAYRIASVSYGLGGLSALELLDARRDLLDAESQYTDALAAANDTRAELERAAATPLDSLETGEIHDH